MFRTFTTIFEYPLLIMTERARFSSIDQDVSPRRNPQQLSPSRQTQLHKQQTSLFHIAATEMQRERKEAA